MVKLSISLALTLALATGSMAAPAMLNVRALDVRCIFGACPPDGAVTGGAKMARATMMARLAEAEPNLVGDNFEERTVELRDPEALPNDIEERCIFGACPPDGTSGGAKRALVTFMAREPEPEPEPLDERCIFGACSPDGAGGHKRMAMPTMVAREPDPVLLEERCIFGACPPDQTGGGAKRSIPTLMV